MTSIKYDHLQDMATISGKFHKNPLETVGGVAETRTSVDKMDKTDKGPVGGVAETRTSVDKMDKTDKGQ